MADLFGLEQQPKRTNDRPESAALVEVLKALRAHPAVVWCERMNSGAARVGNRFIRFGFTGCPDVLGQLTDGRLLGVEVKSPTGKLRPEQSLFLERVRGAGGVAFMARDLRDVLRELNQLDRTGSKHD
ncbi:MAG: VRR-NUC domain-containing protein [Burkholderiales bacterium]|nr:VRR-NUC domain-containing protein [Burkholderiales bacterium]